MVYLHEGSTISKVLTSTRSLHGWRWNAKKLWLSLPCTHWCRWTNVNYNTEERKAVLEDLRRRDRRMMHYAKDFILNAVDDDPDTDVYWEWTFPCSGWSQPPMVAAQHGLLQRGQSWSAAELMDATMGCETPMIRVSSQALEIRTNDELFHRNSSARFVSKSSACSHTGD